MDQWPQIQSDWEKRAAVARHAAATMIDSEAQNLASEIADHCEALSRAYGLLIERTRN
jgi:hypothetical protein